MLLACRRLLCAKFCAVALMAISALPLLFSMVVLVLCVRCLDFIEARLTAVVLHMLLGYVHH